MNAWIVEAGILPAGKEASRLNRFDSRQDAALTGRRDARLHGNTPYFSFREPLRSA